MPFPQPWRAAKRRTRFDPSLPRWKDRLSLIHAVRRHGANAARISVPGWAREKMRSVRDDGTTTRLPLDTYPRQSRQHSQRPESPRPFPCEMRAAFSFRLYLCHRSPGEGGCAGDKKLLPRTKQGIFIHSVICPRRGGARGLQKTLRVNCRPGPLTRRDFCRHV